MLSERVDPLVGTMLGKDFRVIEPIGFGGMAVVYLVEHQTLLKRFAAKVLSTELTANFEARARFTQEAHAASQLDHENIVNISDFGTTGDQRPFFVMDLLRGQTLDQRLAMGPMSLEEIVAVSVPVGRALAYAHAEGIVHRDVKPENIFLVQRSQGRWGIKVVDFGIAKTPVNVRLTKMGQTLGSPYYMAPEACRGEDVDHRADIYSFGILLYLMFCGRLPYEDENLLKVLQMQVSTPLEPPCDVNPDLDPRIGAIIERALAKDVDDRYLSMDALLKELESVLPPGADRLLVEMQTGVTGSQRNTPMPMNTPLPPSASQPMHAMRNTPPSVRVPSGQLPLTPHNAVVAGGTIAAPASSNRWIWIVALLSIVFAAFGVLFAMKGLGGDDDKQPTGGIAAAQPVEQAKAPVPVKADPPPNQATPTATTADPPPPAAKTVHLKIVSRPAGATVKLDGSTLGVTPLDIDVERVAKKAELSLSKAGYDGDEREVDLDAGASLDVTLSRTRVVSTTRRPPPPPPPHDKKPPAGSGTNTKVDPNLDIRLSR